MMMMMEDLIFSMLGAKSTSTKKPTWSIYPSILAGGIPPPVI